MRLSYCNSSAAFVVALGIAFSCLAQNPPSPATLEDLANADEAQGNTKDSAPEAAEAVPNRPAGTVARQEDSVRHPNLDKAWAEYDAVVAKAAEGIKAAISKQFDAATANGDLDAAEKWQTTQEKFEKSGEVPAAVETKAAVSAAVADYKKAKAALAKTYEAVVKELTTEKKISEARAARDELAAIAGKREGVVKPRPAGPERTKVFLSDLPEQDVSVWGTFGKNGSLDRSGSKIYVRGVPFQKGLSMHPPTTGTAKVTYHVPEGFAFFEAIAGMNDSSNNLDNPVLFKVFGDDKLLWSSSPLSGAGRSEACRIAIKKGTKAITLVVECPGKNGAAHAVWCDPRFSKK